jgi:quercetin dioxygenase-like cupin family protein
MKIISVNQKKAFESIFDSANQANKKVQMGFVRLEPGAKIPETGFARHEQDEFSYVVKGIAHTILEDGRDLVGKPGDCQWIESGEGHINYNDGDEVVEVIWFLVER